MQTYGHEWLYELSSYEMTENDNFNRLQTCIDNCQTSSIIIVTCIVKITLIF